MNPNRRFILEVLSSGLELGCVTAETVLAHVTPEVLAHHLPVALKARLLEASLAAERMTPALVVDTVGVEALVEHSPLGALWACVRAAVEQQIEGTQVPGPNGKSDHAEAAGLKPAKSARPVPLSRAPSRISSLSPRSRAMRGRDDDPRQGDGGGGGDYEIVEETDVLRGSPRSSLSSGDEETRPGPKG